MAQIQSGASSDLLTIDPTTKAALIKPGANTTFSVDFSSNLPHIDAFERLKVSEPRIAFEYNFSNGLIAAMWEGTAYGAGSLTQNTTAWVSEFNSTTASGTGYWAQSFPHVRYAPGISTLFRFTFGFNALQVNQVMRVGMFTDQGTFPSANGDGIFLEAQGTGVNIVMRSFTTGGSNETRVAQANWNSDPLNGTGTSGVNLNWSNVQHLVISYEWLGIGNVYVGFQTSNGIVWAHKFSNPNVGTTAWCRTGTLPVRAECYTTGTVSQAAKLTLINCVVQQEGDTLQYRGWRYFGGDSGGTAKTTGTAVGYYPILCLRGLLTNDITKRVTFIPTKASILVKTAFTTSTAASWALIAIPTPLTGATFTGTAGASSFVGYDQAVTSTTAVTGTILAKGLLPVTAGLYTIDFLEQLDNAMRAGQNAAGGLTITGNNVLCLAYGPFDANAGAGAVLWASMNWKELT